jgi:hypothetical protein
MGNCFRRSSILGDNYLFEPLCPEEENIFNESESNKSSCNCDEKIIQVNKEIELLTNKLNILEKNTQDNLKSLSDDLHYINNKTVSSIESN